jgi:hypothetical protein
MHTALTIAEGVIIASAAVVAIGGGVLGGVWAFPWLAGSSKPPVLNRVTNQSVPDDPDDDIDYAARPEPRRVLSLDQCLAASKVLAELDAATARLPIGTVAELVAA